ATLAAVANPAVLIVLVGGVHNDAVALGCTAAGVALALSQRRRLGMLLCALGVAVKPLALLAVGAVAFWAWGGRRRARTRDLVVAAASVAGVLVVCGRGAGGPLRWLTAQGAYAGIPGPWSLGAALLGAGSSRATDLIEVVGLVAAVIVILAPRRPRRSTAALGWGLVLLAVTTPKPEPWYLAWALVFVAAGAPSGPRQRVGVVVLSLMMVGSILPLGVLWWFEGLIALAALAGSAVRDRIRGPGEVPPSSLPVPAPLESSALSSCARG
ncbi:MAG TPA: hypothetical protein VMF60_05720, partial [Acidimicrobiales bacterium]|nr:hypothetical protein [Acidimicrobiales bacterium]